MININRKKASVLLAIVAVAAVVSGIALSAYAADNGEESSSRLGERYNWRWMMAKPHEWYQGRLRGLGCRRLLEVSEEFQENAIGIAESDEDVQALLDEGYDITRVRPVIKTVVEADGDVETKATEAIVVLRNDSASRAAVWVDLEEAEVTKIVILSITVIEKP